MRLYLCALCLMLLAITAVGQTKNNRLGLAVGGGPQDYKGDLGNGFKINSAYDVWRGAVTFNISYYLNRSFDATLFGSVGDMGYCQPEEIANTPVADEDKCPGCEGRVGLGNLNCRFGAAGIAVKYKFANGYLLKEECKVKPYIYAGFAGNKIVDRMHMNCVNEGTYGSINMGGGIKFYVTKRINIAYQLSGGYFMKDNVDRMSHGSSDMYMQNSLLLGVDLF